jgi:hypothetical protein
VLSFALVNWGSSSAWIGAYFLGRIKKTLIQYKLIPSVNGFDSFQCFEERQHKWSFEFIFVRVRGVSAPSSETLFS